MTKNKHTRKLIAGQLRAIAKHQLKIEAEIEKPSPNPVYLQKWEREIDIARSKLRKLERRLEN